jgi:hypothetical protein
VPRTQGCPDTDSFDAVFGSEGVQILRTPVLLGGGHHLLGDRLKQRSEEPLLMGRRIQVDRVVSAQEGVEVQIVAVGRG